MCQKTDDDVPDVLFIKEEHSELVEQERQTQGYLESRKDSCGNGDSSSATQDVLTQELETPLVKGESKQKEAHQETSRQSADMQIAVQNVLNPQNVEPVSIWNTPSSQSHLQGPDESSSSSNPLPNQNPQRKMIQSVDVQDTNSTLYEGTKELESSFIQWSENSPSDIQPSCSYIVEEEQDQDCVLVQPGPVSVKERHKVAASSGLLDTGGLQRVAGEWSTVTTSSQIHIQQFNHFSSTRLNAANRANLTQAVPNFQTSHPGGSLAALHLQRRTEKGKKKSYICRFCGKSFTGQSNLEAHQRIHTGEKPFKCETCGKHFTEAGNLKKHQRVHTGEKPFVCNRCGKSFAWICNLRTHQQSASCGGV